MTSGTDLGDAVEALVGPGTPGNDIAILRNGEKIFPAMLRSIGEAQESVDFLTFTYRPGEVGKRFARAFAERARAGVAVRVLLDAAGSREVGRDLTDPMEDAGVEVRWFRPPTRWRFWETRHRTHRKILVCDSAVGFTGGVGIADEWDGGGHRPGEWRDNHFRIEGPAISGLRAAFLESWFEPTGIIEPQDIRSTRAPRDDDGVQIHTLRSRPGPGWNSTALTVRALIGLAQTSIHIETAYFSPDPPLRDLLCSASRRGVEVTIVVPGPHMDKELVRLLGQAEYEDLIDAGIEIREYQPTMLHSKVMTIDGEVAIVGSVNINSRSLEHDDEFSVVLRSVEVARELDAMILDDCRHSEIVQLDNEDRSIAERIGERALQPFRRWI